MGGTLTYLWKKPGRGQFTLPFPANDVVYLTPHSSPLSPRIWAVGPSRPSLVRGLRPRNAPSPTTCLADLVSLFVTGAQSKEFRQAASPQSNEIPVGAGLVPALTPQSTAPNIDQTHHLPCVSPKSGKQIQSPPARIPSQTFPTPKPRNMHNTQSARTLPELRLRQADQGSLASG